jgi:hypothetical protein
MVTFATSTLKELLIAIGAYEALARILIDAFRSSLHVLSQTTQPVSAVTLAKLPEVIDGRTKAAELLARTQDTLQPLGLAPRLSAFTNLAAPMTSAEWADALMTHHNEIQRAKPPRGRAPWVIRYDDGRYVVRPQYRVDNFKPMPRRYVHQYRAQPLLCFARDLGLLQ